MLHLPFSAVCFKVKERENMFLLYIMCKLLEVHWCFVGMFLFKSLFDKVVLYMHRDRDRDRDRDPYFFGR
uniref:Uncharacterized protein n=1 Tax=Manihot esculenta TaxID=3983 RepID=A0A2C9U262_MANES